MRRTVIAAALAAATFVPVAAHADQQYIDQIVAQLIVAESAYMSNGYTRVIGPEADRMTNGQVESYTIMLEEGTTYIIHGVCDSDCGDLDLQLVDENGNVVSEDSTTDDQPIVNVTPAWSGQFSVNVRMYDCQNSYCYFAMAAYAN